MRFLRGPSVQPPVYECHDPLGRSGDPDSGALNPYLLLKSAITWQIEIRIALISC